MRIFSGNLFSAIKSHEKKSTQAIVTIKNTLAHKLVTCNGIFINSICTIPNDVDGTRKAAAKRTHTSNPLAHRKMCTLQRIGWAIILHER